MEQFNPNKHTLLVYCSHNAECRDKHARTDPSMRICKEPTFEIPSHTRGSWASLGSESPYLSYLLTEKWGASERDGWSVG
jgi:hypothetical protein